MEPLGAIPDDRRQEHASGPACTPRRSAAETSQVIVASYAILFAALFCLGYQWASFLLIICFFTGIGVGQSVLFQGRRPRTASILAGIGLTAVLGPVFLLLLAWISNVGPPRAPFGPRLGLPLFLVASGLAGYVAGLVIADGLSILGKLARAIRERDATQSVAEATIAAAADGLQERRTETTADASHLDWRTLLLIVACCTVTMVYAIGLSTSPFLPGVLVFGVRAFGVLAFGVAVGVGQTVLFRGKRPRTASALVGIAALTSSALFDMAVGYVNGLLLPLSLVLGSLRTAVIGGGIAGYVTGLVIADVVAIVRRINDAAPGIAGRDVPLDAVAVLDEQEARAMALAEAALKPAGVPRRFGVGTLLVITAFYAVLFGLLTSLGTEPALDGVSVVFIVVVPTMFVTFVGIGQAVLFQGKKPRLASIVVGASAFLLMELVIVVIEFWRFPGFLAANVELVIGWFTLSVIYGSILGYVAGGLIGGVFLVMRWVTGKTGAE